MSTHLKPLDAADLAATEYPRPAETANKADAVARPTSLGASAGKLSELNELRRQGGGPFIDAGSTRRQVDLPGAKAAPLTVAQRLASTAVVRDSLPSGPIAHQVASPEHIAGLLAGSTRRDSSACVLVVDFSPDVDIKSPEATQLFTELESSINRGLLARGSTVALHVSASWLQPGSTERFAHVVEGLRGAGIHVLISKVEGAVYGQIGEGSLAGGDRQGDRVDSILKCSLVDSEVLPADVPKLRSKVLLESLFDAVGPVASGTKVIAVCDRGSQIRDHSELVSQLRGSVRLGSTISRRAPADVRPEDDLGQIGALLKELVPASGSR